MFECKEFYEEGRQLDRMQQDSRHNIRHEGEGRLPKLHSVWFYKKHCKISTSAVSYFGLEFQLVTVS